MRTLKLQVQTTVDGYMSGPDGAMDWLTSPWSDDLSAYVDTLGEKADCIVLGRRLAEGFIPAWAAAPEGETQESIDWMNDTPKVVISGSLAESPWPGAAVMGGDLAEIVADLKSRPGGDLIVYGGGTLVRGLIAQDLIDDLHLFVNPAATGGGMPVFPGGDAPRRLRLVEARGFACGVTGLHYRPARG